MEVATGVYQLKLPIPDNPLEYLNAYLVGGNGDYGLIDSGWPSQEALNSLKRQLKEISVDLRDIATIVVTHGHLDHFGLAGEIRRLSGAQIIMHQMDAPQLGPHRLDQQWFSAQMREWLTTNGMPEEKLATLGRPFAASLDFAWLVPPDKTVRGGEVISIGPSRLEVIWTPGHSPGHICLYDAKNKILFSGDHTLPVITPNVSLNPRTAVLGNPLGIYFDSLRKVKSLETDLVLPAHEHVFSNLRQRVEELFTHHEERISDLLNSLGDGEKTAYQIAIKMLWVGLTGIVLGENLPETEQPGAIGETLAHLELLMREGRVQKLVRDGIALFRAIA